MANAESDCKHAQGDPDPTGMFWCEAFFGSYCQNDNRGCDADWAYTTAVECVLYCEDNNGHEWTVFCIVWPKK